MTNHVSQRTNLRSGTILRTTAEIGPPDMQETTNQETDRSEEEEQEIHQWESKNVELETAKDSDIKRRMDEQLYPNPADDPGPVSDIASKKDKVAHVKSFRDYYYKCETMDLCRWETSQRKLNPRMLENNTHR